MVELGRADVVDQLRALGVLAGGVVLVHTSFRMVRPIAGGPSGGFAAADGWLRASGQQAEGPVGHAPARLARARDIVTAAIEHLSRDPLLFLHPPSAGCEECDEARRSVER